LGGEKLLSLSPGGFYPSGTNSDFRNFMKHETASSCNEDAIKAYGGHGGKSLSIIYMYIYRSYFEVRYFDCFPHKKNEKSVIGHKLN
jgi:hypothetical protein